MGPKVIRAGEAAERSTRRGCCDSGTVHLHDPTLPAWLADPHIQHGYRLPGGWCQTLRSVCSCHNETLNIYTHGVGVVFFLVVGVTLLLGSGWQHSSSLFTFTSLASPGPDDVLAATLRHFSDGAHEVERAASSFLGLGPAEHGRPAMPWSEGAEHGGEEGPFLCRNGRHTAAMLFARQRRASGPGAAAGKEGLVAAASTALSGLVHVATSRVGAAVRKLEQLASTASRDGRIAAETVASTAGGAVSAVGRGLGDAGRAVEMVRGAADGYFRALSEAVRRADSPDGREDWEPRSALAGLADAAEALEMKLEADLDGVLEAAARELGVAEARRRLQGGALTAAAAAGEEASEAAADGGARGGGRSAAGHVRALAAGRTSGSARRAPRWPVLVFVCSALVCLACSVAFHLFWVVSQTAYRLLARLDYSGIALLIGGSCCPVIEYALACDRTAVLLASTFMYSLCAAAVAMGLTERFSAEAWRPVRAGVFVGVGCAGILPIVWVALTVGDDPVVRQALAQMVVMGVMYVVGAGLYVSRVPERFFPGMLDLFGASHQLFHALVFGAALLHYHTVLLLFRWRDMQPACPS